MPEPPCGKPGPEEEAGRGQTQQTLLSALDRLAERRRAAVILHESFGYTAAEVGEALDCTTAAATMTIFRGRRQLREMLEPVWEEKIG